MIKISVGEAAKRFRVSQKTINVWINEGLPVAKVGKQGRGNASQIDFARATEWMRQKKGIRPFSWGEHFAEARNAPPNPLRWLLQLYADDMPHMVKTGLLAWLNEPDGKSRKTAWESLGLTRAQAERTVWDIFGWIIMMLHQYKLTEYEKNRLLPVTGGADLDDLATMWFFADVDSKWDESIDFPDEILAFAPPEKRAMFEKPKR